MNIPRWFLHVCGFCIIILPVLAPLIMKLLLPWFSLAQMLGAWGALGWLLLCAALFIWEQQD